MVALVDAGLVSAPQAAPIQEWFAQYLHWMRTHKYGIDERDHGNNHSTTWALQAASFAALTNNDEALDEAAELFRRNVGSQIEPEGTMPLELRRRRPYHYTLFNLDAFSALAQQLALAVRPVWGFETGDGRSLEQALEWMAPFIADKSTWTMAPDVELFDSVPVRTPGLLFPALAHGRDDWFTLWASLPDQPDDQDEQRGIAVRSPGLWL